MSVHDDDLLPELRRSTDPVDRRLARLLGRLAARRPAAPRASKSLATFLAEASTASAPLDPSTDNVTAPVASTGHDHVVQLGRPAPRSSPMRSRLIPLKKVLKTGLLAKVMLGTTVALTGVGAAAATGNLPGAGDDNMVVVTPSGDSRGSSTPADDPVGVIDLDDQGEDDADTDADDDGGPGDDDQGEDNDDQGEDEPGDDDGDNSGAGGGDDQGEDDDDQGEDDDDQGEDESGDDDGDDNSGPGDDDSEGDDDSDDDDSDDDDSDEDGDNSGGDDDEGEDDESGDD